MPQTDVEAVEDSDEYIHVRFRDLDDFAEIRTPDWASDAADSVADGAEVRTGKEMEGDDWLVQSVLIPDEADEGTAREHAKEIVEKIES